MDQKKARAGYLLIAQTLSQPKVIEFLDSYAMNSKRTKSNYSIGLSHFQTFLNKKYSDSPTITSILERVSAGDIDVYLLLNQFIQFLFGLTGDQKLSRGTIKNYLTAVRSYFQNYDVEISPWKFKHKVRLPKIPKAEEQVIDAIEIRKILKATNNRRLKAYLLVLASSGLRATEAVTLRIKDFDFESKPTRVHVRPEFAKTRVERYVYISNEATEAVKQWIDFKYRDRVWQRQSVTRVQLPDDIVFTIKTRQPGFHGMYQKLVVEFNKVLRIAGLDERKDGMKRRKITLHSFRRFVYTTISDQVGKNAAEAWLGHARSEYHVKKESEKREIYVTRCMKYLTFLEFEQLETTGKNIEAQLEEKDREIQYLRDSIEERDRKYETDIKAINDRMSKIDAALNNVQKLEKELRIA